MQGLPLEKLCNALLQDAAPSGLVSAALGGAVDRAHKRHGGLWVGGKMVATDAEVAFTPNRMNVALHAGLRAVHLPWAEIRAVRREFGWITGIVVVEHRHGEFRFRCFGATAVARILSARCRR